MIWVAYILFGKIRGMSFNINLHTLTVGQYFNLIYKENISKMLNILRSARTFSKVRLLFLGCL